MAQLLSYAHKAKLLLDSNAPIIDYPGVRSISSLICSTIDGEKLLDISSNEIFHCYERWMRTAFISTCGVYPTILLKKNAHIVKLSSIQKSIFETLMDYKLRADGYVFIPEFFNAKFISNIVHTLSEYNVVAQLSPSQRRVSTNSFRLDILRQGNPIRKMSSRFFYSSVALKMVQPLILRELAPVMPMICEYLGTPKPEVFLDGWISIGVSGNVSTQELSANAQAYHYDFDALKFLKIFIYLTDVLDSNFGPHEFIVGSHCGMLSEIKDYLVATAPNSRIDSKQASLYPSCSHLSYFGRVGSLIIEDTSGLHRGKPLGEGAHREMLVLTLANTTSKKIKNDIAQAYAMYSK